MEENVTKTVKLIDTTLREGEQTPGVLFAHTEKKRIVGGLVEAGVSEIELGVSSPLTAGLEELVTHCLQKYPDFRFGLWSRCLESDIAYAAQLGVQIVSLSMPVSDLHLQKKMAKGRIWVEEKLCSCIRLAKSLGLEVAVGFEDATRAEQDFVVLMALAAEQAGAFRVRLADTVGVASPLAYAELVEKVSSALSSAQVGVHTHNDFGMAVGNAIAAAERGAQWLDGALLGLGERTGCAALEQLMGFLVLADERGDMNIKRVKRLARYVSRITGESISSRQPVLGESIFACETGLHLQGLFKEPSTYEPYSPEKIGAQRKLLIGAKCGKDALKRQMNILGVENLSESAVEQCVQLVRRTSRELGRSLNGKELLDLCRQG